MGRALPSVSRARAALRLRLFPVPGQRRGVPLHPHLGHDIWAMGIHDQGRSPLKYFIGAPVPYDNYRNWGLKCPDVVGIGPRGRLAVRNIALFATPEEARLFADQHADKWPELNFNRVCQMSE